MTETEKQELDASVEHDMKILEEQGFFDDEDFPPTETATRSFVDSRLETLEARINARIERVRFEQARWTLIVFAVAVLLSVLIARL